MIHTPSMVRSHLRSQSRSQRPVSTARPGTDRSQARVAPGTSVLALAVLTGGFAWGTPTAIGAQLGTRETPVGPETGAAPAIAQTYDILPPPAPAPGQVGYPVPVDPTYTSAVPPVPTPGTQYVVYIPGDSPVLLDQVRLSEPGAFRTTYQGQSVIQVGRYSVYQNAQNQVSLLASQGIGAEIGESAAVVPTYGLVPAPPPSPYVSNGELPPLPVVPMTGGTTTAPSAVPAVPTVAAAPNGGEFGQPSNFNTGGMTPPPATVPPTAAAPVAAPIGAPYYVVIPAGTNELPYISSQVIQLGTPADRVQQRQSPLGPHVAVGPFQDKGLAERWSNYFRDAGLLSSRVIYEP